MKMRIGAIVAFIVALSLTACVSEEPAPTGVNPQQGGGTVVSALSASPPHLNSAIISDVGASIVTQAIYEGLITLTQDHKLEPALAQSWTMSDDGLTYTFSLQTGVKWHDGQPFTSADVKFSAEKALPLKPTGQDLVAVIDEVIAPEDETVVFKLKRPFPAFLRLLNPKVFAILPEHVFGTGDLATHPNNLQPVGTGPFKFVSYVPGDQAILARNDDYWGAVKPSLDQIVYKIIPDTNSQIAGLKSGEIDHVSYHYLSTEGIAEIEKTKGITLDADLSQPTMLMMYFNIDTVRDPAVRKALVQGIDRQYIADNVYSGLASPGRSPIPNFGYDWDATSDVDFNKMYPFGPEAARAALTAAGAENLRIGLPYAISTPHAQQVAEILASNLADIGVEVALQPQERDLWIDRVYLKSAFHVTIGTAEVGLDPALGLDRLYRCEPDRGAILTNATNYCYLKLDSLFDTANEAVDEVERGKIYQQIQGIIAEDLPAVPLTLIDHRTALNTDQVQGFAEFFRTGGWQHLSMA